MSKSLTLPLLKQMIKWRRGMHANLGVNVLDPEKSGIT